MVTTKTTSKAIFPVNLCRVIACLSIYYIIITQGTTMPAGSASICIVSIDIIHTWLRGRPQNIVDGAVNKKKNEEKIAEYVNISFALTLHKVKVKVFGVRTHTLGVHTPNQHSWFTSVVILWIIIVGNMFTFQFKWTISIPLMKCIFFALQNNAIRSI